MTFWGVLAGGALAVFVGGCVHYILQCCVEASGKARELSFDPRVRRIIPAKLPPGVWSQLQADMARGARERRIRLKVCHTYRLDPPQLLLSKYMGAIGAMKDPNVQQLYHGTGSFGAVLSITDGGFRLPPKTHPNMFGPGVYFATVPQKSYDYTGPGGWILICNVAVGKPRKVKKAKFIDPDKDLTARSWFFWTKTYDSVHAPAGASTVSDEHIVYDVDKIYPAYLVSVKRV